MAFFNFDATKVAPQAAIGPVPAGTYLAQITESSLDDLKSGNGQGLKLTFEILDGQFKGRRVWETLNIVHSNEKTQGIAQSQLSAICHAIGVLKPNDTSELNFKPLKINVTVREAEGNYAARNNIKGYEGASGSMPSHVAATPVAPAANTAKAAPAWAKKAA